ncbi:Pyrimidine dimer DNA glycosylase [Candidatus Bilamarchaeum dharawalense]|uniref:Pyrimidine dimer DNA glycosylase n=1 Tax=Candidatus Bilamarchaeum dharawalense TaxID=2885759 RepID=A0A5E4LVF4_9ARCH|nr:Pyrimidine dimer DNA glycosylase [Candidatus Bilamarchaeum dharawalense]
MRIWDLPPTKLCRPHLLAEHRELHAIWTILTKNKKGYSHHPETLRWKDKLKALYLRHELLVEEFGRRNYSHKSPLDKKLATGRSSQLVYVDRPTEQKKILKRKKCNCKV